MKKIMEWNCLPKQAYQKPQIDIIEIQQQANILAGSPIESDAGLGFGGEKTDETDDDVR